jgi:hypothetical protein
LASELDFRYARLTHPPTIAVAGQYTVTGDHKTMLAVSDELLAKARAEEKKPGR